MFGDKLRALRTQQEMTQTDVAKRLGITQASYNRYEKNLYEPDFDTLKKLAKLFHVSTDYLLGNDDEEFFALDESLVDMDYFLLYGNYTIRSRFPTATQRRMLSKVVDSIFEGIDNKKSC